MDDFPTVTGELMEPYPSKRLAEPHNKGLSDSQSTDISIYWGYRVRAQKTSLGTILEKEKYDLKIGTSRYGKQLKDAWSELTNLLNDEVTVMVAFGSPMMGVQEILEREGITPTSVFDMFLNTVPHQETLTVRTEEAIAITLATLNLLRSM